MLQHMRTEMCDAVIEAQEATIVQGVKVAPEQNPISCLIMPLSPVASSEVYCLECLGNVTA